MKRYGIAIEKWDCDRELKITSWLEENFGEIEKRWDIDHDYDLFTLCMDEDVYIMFLLRWS